MASWKYDFTIEFTSSRLFRRKVLVEIRNPKATILILANDCSMWFDSCSLLYVTFVIILEYFYVSYSTFT
jgi:hypothetical protein